MKPLILLIFLIYGCSTERVNLIRDSNFQSTDPMTHFNPYWDQTNVSCVDYDTNGILVHNDDGWFAKFHRWNQSCINYGFLYQQVENPNHLHGILEFQILINSSQNTNNISSWLDVSIEPPGVSQLFYPESYHHWQMITLNISAFDMAELSFEYHGKDSETIFLVKDIYFWVDQTKQTSFNNNEKIIAIFFIIAICFAIGMCIFFMIKQLFNKKRYLYEELLDDSGLYKKIEIVLVIDTFMIKTFTILLLFSLSYIFAERINLIKDGSFDATDPDTGINPYWKQTYTGTPYWTQTDAGKQYNYTGIIQNVDDNWVGLFRPFYPSFNLAYLVQNITTYPDDTLGDLEFDFKVTNTSNFQSGFILLCGNQTFLINQENVSLYPNWTKINMTCFLPLDTIYIAYYNIYCGDFTQFWIDNLALWVEREDITSASDTSEEEHDKTNWATGSIVIVSIFGIILASVGIVFILYILKSKNMIRDFDYSTMVEYEL